MTVSEIVKKINQLPNYLYVFYGDEGYHKVILGGHSCLKKEEYENLNGAEYYFNRMKKLYEKENLTDDEKATIGRDMKCVMRICDYRVSKLYKIEQQEEYLNGLSKDSLEEISSQIQMYIKAREYHRNYVYKRN